MVDDVSLEVAPGEFVSIVGPSGCGKTTLLNFAAGLLPADVVRGTYLVGGKPPVSGNRDIAYMLARDALCAVAHGARAMPSWAPRSAACRRPSAAPRALELLDKVGLKGFENAYPKALSQGMRQRVALARTFSLDAPILLMDEPFGALDAQTKLQLEDVLLSLWQRERRTVRVRHPRSERGGVDVGPRHRHERAARAASSPTCRSRSAGRARCARCRRTQPITSSIPRCGAKLEEGLSQ